MFKEKEKDMPNPQVGKNVIEGDRESEMPCEECGSKEHKTSGHKKGKKSYDKKKRELAEKKK